MPSRLQSWPELWLTHLDRFEKSLLVLFSIAYFSFFHHIAAKIPLWNDEIFTSAISRYKSVSELLDTLRLAADQQPPLYYVLTNLVISVFGDTTTALRLLSMLGVWLACLSVYFFLRRRAGAAPAWCAMAALLASDASRFATEARPYALAMGISGLLALAWQTAASGSRRAWAIPLIALCSSLLTSVHYFAIILLLPVAAAEIVRSRCGSRIDWPVVAALGAGLVPPALHLPLLLEIRGFSTVFWSRPSLAGSVLSAGGQLVSSFLAVSLLSLMFIFLLAARYPGEGEPDPIPAHEACFALSYLVLPFILPPALLLLAGGFVARYVSGLLLGCALVMGWAVTRFSRGRHLVVLAALVLLAIAGAARLADESRMGFAQFRWNEIQAVRALLQGSDNRIMVLIDSPLLFLEFWYHADRMEKMRVFYVGSPARALRHLGTDSPEQSLLRLAKTLPIPVKSIPDLKPQSEFLLIRTGQGLAWITRALSESGADFRVLKDTGRMQLLQVKLNRPLASEEP
jgi:hypothetical protein